MLSVSFPSIKQIVCLGAHSDDIEIGCGGTLLKLLNRHPNSKIHWVVFSARGVRKEEAQNCAESLVGDSAELILHFYTFRDGFFPYEGAELKEAFEDLKLECDPDLVFTHYGKDLHQDHREVSQLTWNTFRNHLVLEYEIPKYDGGLGSPNFFVPLSTSERELKIRFLLDSFQSQSTKPWFCAETFDGLMRLRGMECNAETGYAEAFYCRKVCYT